jgi:ribosomal protein S18 acetylase RimI-like enzyme
MNQFNSRTLSILNSEGIAGLMNRAISRLLRKPQLINLCVLKLDYKDIAKLPPPTIDLQIREVTETDDSDTETLAKFGFHGDSMVKILQYLADGQRCYTTKYKGQVISCYWHIVGDFYDYFLKRRFYLTDTEEYILGAFTLAEFRGKGILPYLIEESSRERVRNCPNLRAIAFVRVNNKASLRSFHKLGFKIIGRVGFVEILGIRFHFLLGRDALRKTTKRIFLQMFQ